MNSAPCSYWGTSHSKQLLFCFGFCGLTLHARLIHKSAFSQCNGTEQTWHFQSLHNFKYLLRRIAPSLLSNSFALSPNNRRLGLVSACANRWELSTVCVPERVWCVGVLVQGCSVPWCRLEQGSHADTAARPICASHTVTITELLTLEALSSHIAVKPLTMPHAPIPKPRSCSPTAQLPALTFMAVD